MAINLNEILKDFHSIVIDDGGGSITVDAVNLDIRNLVFADDKVDVSGSEVSLDSATLAALENITVSATDLDIRDLAFATDKVDVSGSEVSLDSATLAALENVVVSATDLDIRDLAFATDKVDVSGSTITTVEGGYDTWKVTKETVTTTAAEIVSTPLAGRLRLEIQNLGTQDAWVKNDNTVTAGDAGNGFKIPKGSSWEVGLDDGADIFAVTATGTAVLKVAEFAA